MVSALVMSHWVLDFVSHRPDLPLYPGGSAYFGLGLWNSVPATLVVEGTLFIAGLWLYLSATRPRDRTGVVALWTLVVVLLGAYFSAAFGPPPPSVEAVAWSGILGWLTVPWATGSTATAPVYPNPRRTVKTTDTLPATS